MELLFVDAYFYPENIAFSHIEQDIIEGLVRAGNDVTVICPTPTRGISREEALKYSKIKRQELNGVRVHRFWAPQEGKNPVIRAFRYFWCHFRGNIIAKRYKSTEAVFAVSTPPTQGYFAGKAAKKLGVPFVYSLQDVFPDSLVTTGLASEKSPLYKIGAKIEKKTYRLCSKIIVLSETVRQNLLNKGVEPEKLLTVNNWIDTEAVRYVPKEENRLFDEYGIDKNKYTVVYAGNFGASQGADVILRAAQLLREREDIEFVIFGGGSEFEKAQSYVLEQRLENVIINPLLPPDRVSEAYSMGDLALITCKKGVGKTALPSKLWSIMACTTPIAASFDTDSELADILRISGAGICVEPENPEKLAEAILNSVGIKKPTLSRKYVEEHASKKAGAKKYVEIICGEASF